MHNALCEKCGIAGVHPWELGVDFSDCPVCKLVAAARHAAFEECAEKVRAAKVPAAPVKWQEIHMKERDVNDLLERVAREIEEANDGTK